MTAEQLRPTFEPYGNIEEVSIIHDKVTQASRGCGFVTFSTEEAARTAIEAVNEKIVLNGKPLVVKFAEGLRQRMEHRLYVANIPPETSEEDLGALFGEHGEVKQIQVHASARPRSIGGTFHGPRRCASTSLRRARSTRTHQSALASCAPREDVTRGV